MSNAFFHVPEDELCYVRPPVEWLARQKHDDWMWLLSRLLNGRRKGPQKWVQWAGDQLEKLGVMRCIAAPYFFRDPTTDVCVEAHMDDFYITGPLKHVEAVIAKLALIMVIKVDGPFLVFVTHGHTCAGSELGRSRALWSRATRGTLRSWRRS